MAYQAKAGSAFSVRTQAGESGSEWGSLVFWEKWEWRGAGSGGKDLCLVDANNDAMWGAQFHETAEVEVRIFKSNWGVTVVEVGRGRGLGTVVIVAHLAESFACAGTLGELLVERFENFGEDEGGEEGAEWAALGKPFWLLEVVPLAGMINVPAGVGVGVEEVKEREEPGEEAGESVATGFAGTGIEHVDDIQGNEDSGLGGWVGDVAGDKEAGKVGNGVDTARDADSELAEGEEVSSCLMVNVGCNDGAQEATPAGANAEWAFTVEVLDIFIKGQEVGAAEGFGKGGGLCQ